MTREDRQIWKINLNPNMEEFRRSRLLERYTAKILFEQNDKKFKNGYLKKLEKIWNRWKGKDKIIREEEIEASSFRVGTLKRE